MTVLSAAHEVLTSEPFVVLIAPALLIFYYVWQCTFHPLGYFPGPFWAKLSSLPLVYQCRRTRKSKWAARQHELYGRFVRIAPNHISITDPAAITQIYGGRGFLKGPFYEDRSPFLDYGRVTNMFLPFHQVEPVLFNTRDANIHNRKWRFMNGAFSRKNLQDFEVYMDPNIVLLVKALEKFALESKACDFVIWANFLAFDLMGEWSFGVSFGFLSAGEDIHNLINTLDKRSDVINALGHLPLFLRPYMKYFILDPFWYKGLRVLSNLGAVATSAFRKRLAKAERGEDLKRKDLMGFLLAAKDPDTGGPLRQQEILAEAISSIGGGSHTTSLTMTHFMDFVSRDQELQEEMWKELCDAFPGPVGVDWVASEEVAEKLPLLNAVIKEAMRIRPATSTGLERVVPEGGRIVGDIFLPGGSLVSVPIVVIHNDGSIYENPEKFDPHRWLRPKAKELSDCYIPFSLGSRACAGRVFAMMEMCKTLATIFRRYRFERMIEGPSEVREGFVVKITECNVRISLREQ